MKYIAISFFLCAQASVRDPFNFEEVSAENSLLVTAHFVDTQRQIYFNEHLDKIQITLQEKSPSTLEKS